MTHQLYVEQVATLKRKEALHEMTMQQLKEQMEQQRQQCEMTIANMMMMLNQQQQQQEEEQEREQLPPPMEKQQHECRHEVGVVAVKSPVALRHTAFVLNEKKQRGIHNRWKEGGEPLLQTTMEASGACYERTGQPRCVATLQEQDQKQQPSTIAINQKEDECIHSCEPNNKLNKEVVAEDNNFYGVTPTMEMVRLVIMSNSL